MNKTNEKIRSIKNILYDLLIKYIPDPIAKLVGGFKNKVISLFKINTPKKTIYGRRKKLSKPKTQNKINSIRNPFILKNKNKKKKKAIITRIIGDIWNIHETKKERKEQKEIRQEKEIDNRLIKDKREKGK